MLRVAQHFAILTKMIKSFRHKGLEKFYRTGVTSGIQPLHAQKLRIQLVALDTATVIQDIDLPGFRLHQLKGKERGSWAIDVNKNWRLTFNFIEGDVYILNYEDYH